MLYSLSYIKKVIKYSFHELLDIQRHNMSWEDYMAKIFMIHPQLEVLPAWINYLDTFNKRENMISASTMYENGYKDRNPIVYNDP